MTDNHRNGHRLKKKPVQVLLNEEEQEILESIKSLRNIKQNSELFKILLNEELKRNEATKKAPKRGD